MAGMVLHYGTFSFTPGEPVVTIDKTQNYSARGQKSTRTVTCNVTGQLICADKTAFNTAITNLEAAFAKDGQDFTLKYPDNSTKAFEIVSSATKTGTKVTAEPGYPTGNGPEFADNGVRTYSITVTADYDVDPDGTDAVTAWTETTEMWGGLPIYQHAVVVNGAPQSFRTADQTHYHLTQTGSSVGKNSYVVAPGFAVTPNGTSLINEDYRYSATSPTEHYSPDGTVLRHEGYAATWNYSFISTSAMNDGTYVYPGVWDGSAYGV
jgi:hypothetical protein